MTTPIEPDPFSKRTPRDSDLYEPTRAIQAVRHQVSLGLLHHFSIATALVFLLFGANYVISDTKLELGLFEMVLGLAQLLNLWIVRRFGLLLFGLRFLVISVYFMSLLIFVSGGLGNTGYLWLLFIPLFTMLLFPSREAIRWVLAYSVVVLSLVGLSLADVLPLPYSWDELRQSVIVYFLVMFLTYHNEKIKSIGRNLLQQQNQELHRLSQQDPLTGLYNRGYLTHLLEKQSQGAQEAGTPLSLLMVDLDHFKTINDRLGHQAGDQVLRKIATLLKDVLPEGVSIGRWGGEEFVVLCPGLTLSQAQGLAEQLRHKIELTPFAVDWSVTASFGVVAYHGEPVENTLKAVDDLLYAAKAAGRNRVLVQSDSKTGEEV
ncbi:GGDEF domain-containing protein [Hydrogenovibrio halophilus]|uniref:GGDEF domain-containing protein n=1 Tax=Hydrogenovibrio halophilus TaxID=373391 RepID=UPI0003751DCE|nr:GGDEF domain-containing protein [Hydrogenovibrio halophilus]